MPTIRMPDGQLVNFSDEWSRQDIKEAIASKFPELEPPDYSEERTALGQTWETIKAVPRGFGRTLLTAAEGVGELADAATNVIGLENLIDSGDDNALVYAARQGQKAINQSWLGVDDAYQDAWMTKFGEGLGSMATFFTPTAALRIAGIAGRATKSTTALASALGTGIATERVQRARDEGIEISGGQEDAAALVGAIIGLTELLPVKRLLRHLDPDLIPAAQKATIMQKLSSAFISGGAEGLQEVSADLMQDLTEQKIYNPDVDFGAEALDSFTIGGAVGFTADLVLTAMAGRRGNTYTGTQETEELQKRDEERQATEIRKRKFESVATLRGGRPVEEVEVEELDPAIIPPKSDNMVAYAKDIATQMGAAFPTDTSFDIEQVSIPVTEDTTEPAFQVVDSQGKAYGSPRLEYEEAAVLAGTLNREIVDQTARNGVDQILDNSPEQYETNVPLPRTVSKDGRSFQEVRKPLTDPTAEMSQRETLEVIGNRIKNPRANEITSDALNMAAETTVDKGFEENLTAEKAMQRNMGRVFTEQDMVNSLTAAQRVNRKRLARGIPETSTFTVEEAKEVLGDKFGRLGDIGAGGILETQRYSVSQDRKGNPIVLSTAGEVITTDSIQRRRKRDGKPYVKKRKIQTEDQAQRLAERLNSRYDRAVDEVVFEDITAGNAELKALLERKNIPNELDSPAIKTMAKAFVGKENVNDMDTGEKKFFYQKIRKLPVVPAPLTEGLPDFDQASTLTQDTTVVEEPLALPPPDQQLASDELVAEMQERLDAELKRKNLAGKGVTGKIFKQFREYGLNKAGEVVFTGEVEATAEGAYLRDFNQIAFGIQQAIAGKDVDMNDPDAVFAAIKDVLNHETVHALRTLDLFTSEEYQVLEMAAQNTKRKGEDITYLEFAEFTYEKLSRTQQMEEAIAELVRQNTTLGGRPRTIINKIKDTLEAIARWITASSPGVKRIVESIESGEIGGREAGEVRTLRATRGELGRYEYEDMAATPSGRRVIGDTSEELEAELAEEVAELDEQPIALSTITNNEFLSIYVSGREGHRLKVGEPSYNKLEEKIDENHFTAQQKRRQITNEQITKVMKYGRMWARAPNGATRAEPQPGDDVFFQDDSLRVVAELRGKELVLKTVYRVDKGSEILFSRVAELEQTVEDAEVAHSQLDLSQKIDVVLDRVVDVVGGDITKAEAKKAVMDFRDTIPEEKGKLKPRTSFDKVFDTFNVSKLAERENLAHKEVIKRIPDITVATILYKDGLINRDQRTKIVNKTKPVTPYETLEDKNLTSKDKAVAALKEPQRRLFGKTWEAIKDKALEYVALRLDIPAYSGRHGAWVVTVHNPRSAASREQAGGRGPFEGDAKLPIGYERAMSVEDVSFGIGRERNYKVLASGVAAGAGSKSTFATIEGRPEKKSYGSLLQESRRILKDMREGKETNWRQVGYDPERHTYFYDRTTGEPIVSADRVIQIGPLVLAENANTDAQGQVIDTEAYLGGQEIAFSRRFDDSVLLGRGETGKEKAYREGREARMSRRSFVSKMAVAGIGGAATINNLLGSESDTVTLGRAKPVSKEILDTPLNDTERTILKAAWSSRDPLGINGSTAIKEVLDSISMTGPTELKRLARDISALMPTSGVKLKFIEGNWNRAGEVSIEVPATMTLYGERGLDLGTFLHESLHANVISRWMTLSIMHGSRRLTPEESQAQREKIGITAAESEAYLQFENIWNEFKDASAADYAPVKKKADENAAAKLPRSQDNPLWIMFSQSRGSIDEFFVRALTDPNLQQYLSTKRYEGRTLLEVFKNWVTSTIFGSRSGEEASWLDAALTASNDINAVFSTRTPNFAVVQTVNEINNGPLVAVPEQEISYSRTGITIPEVAGTEPILPIGEVENALQELLQRTNGNPTSQELAEMPGAPTPRMIKDNDGDMVPDLVRDGNVKPTSLDKLRKMARRGLRKGTDGLNWYEQFAKGLREVVGRANMEEASVIFGITSQQNSAEQNLADTLHIMSVARKFDPVTNTAAFIKEVREGTRPRGQRLKVSGNQISRIVRLYNEGFANAGLKTSTYMQLIQDRERNAFNPFSVQDVHMARAFGFRRKDFNKKTGNLVDAAVIPGDLQYRYAQYLTSYLAQEFGITPNEMQAALWFVAKDTLSKRDVKAGAGTWDSAKSRVAPEIKAIEDQVGARAFNRDAALTPALKKGVRPRNAPTTKTDPYTNYLQVADLTELAAQRAPRAIVSAKPGNAYGYGFPDTVSLEDITEFNKGAVDVITDQDGQIPFIKEMGIPHTVESAFGTYEGVEPNIQVRLLGGTLDQTNFIAQVLGDALLQDAVLTSKPTINSNERVGIRVIKSDGSSFTEEEIMAIAAKANPDKDPSGLNFTMYNDDKMLAFVDGRTFDREALPDYTPEMATEFKEKVLNGFDNDVQYLYNAYTEEGQYYERSRYLKAPRKAGLETSAFGRSDILSTANDTLYKPFWDYYTSEAERIGFVPQNLVRPVPPLMPDLFRPEFPIPREIPPAEVEAAVEKNLEALENTTGGAVPTFSVKASPEAQAVARNPDLGATLTEDQNIFYSRTRPSDPETRAAVDKVIQQPPQSRKKGWLENLLPGGKDDDTYKSVFSKFRQGYINRYEPLEKMDQMMRKLLGTLADSSAYFGMIMADRSKNLAAGSLTKGVIDYSEGTFKTKDFIYQSARDKKLGIKARKIDGMLGVLQPLMASENVFGENLMEVFQSLAIAKRAKEINDSGKRSPVPKGKEDAYLAEMEAVAAKYINPKTNQSYITEVYEMYQAYNNEVIKLMKKAGLITDKEAESWSRSAVYYPFYKDFAADPDSERNQETKDGKLVKVDSILDIGEKSSPSFLPQEKIGSQKLRRLEGSRLRIDVPPLEAMVRNLDAAINMSMKNIAYQRAMRDAVYLGFASKIEKGRKMRALKKGEVSNDIYIREKGKDVHYKVHDQLLFAALTPIADGSLVTSITTVTSIPARFLRESITRSPGFMGVNMLRDTLSAFVTSGASFIPFLDTAKNFSTDLTEYDKLGIVTGYDNINDPKDLAAFLKKEMRKKGIDTGASKGTIAWEKSLGRIWDLLGKGTQRSDFATRKAVYDDVLARTGSQAEASFQAIEVLNFGRRGGNTGYRMIAAATPFLNARIQGLDILWRSGLGTYSSRSDLGKAQIQRNAFLRAGYLTALTAFYWLLVSDDDQYKEASDYVRDNNWLIPNPFGPEAFKVPIPFEIGLLFKTFPEKILDATFKEATARDFAQTVGRGVLTTLEMNPLGMFQITAPLIEAGVNKNFYTGRQIVPYYIDQGVVKGLQDRVTTTQLSKWLGQATGMSPLKIDHVLKGYAGTLGIGFINMTDTILRSKAITGDFADSMPTSTLATNPMTRRFFAREEGTGLAEDFYEMNQYVQQAVQTLGKLEREGRIEEYQKFLYGREHLLDLKGDFNKIGQELGELRKAKTEILRMDIHPDSKRDQIQALDKYINEYLEIVPMLKELVRLPMLREATFKEGGP